MRKRIHDYPNTDDYSFNSDPDQARVKNQASYGMQDYEGSRSFRSTLDYQGYRLPEDYDNGAWTSDQDFGNHNREYGANEAPANDAPYRSGEHYHPAVTRVSASFLDAPSIIKEADTLRDTHSIQSESLITLTIVVEQLKYIFVVQ